MEEVPDHDMHEPHGARTRTSAFPCHHAAVRAPATAAAVPDLHRTLALLLVDVDHQPA